MRFNSDLIDLIAFTMASGASLSKAISRRPSVVCIERMPSTPLSSLTVLTWISVGSGGCTLSLSFSGYSPRKRDGPLWPWRSAGPDGCSQTNACANAAACGTAAPGRIPSFSDGQGTERALCVSRLLQSRVNAATPSNDGHRGIKHQPNGPTEPSSSPPAIGRHAGRRVCAQQQRQRAIRSPPTELPGCRAKRRGSSTARRPRTSPAPR